MHDIKGSPLAARQNPHIYLIIVFLIIFVGIVLLIYFISKIIKKNHSTPEYIALQRNKETSQKNVIALAKKLQLTQSAQTLLWDICKTTKAKNIFYSYTNEEYLNSIFKEYFLIKKSQNKAAKELLEIFKLNFLIYKKVSLSKNISSSKSIPINSTLSFPTKTGIIYQFKLEKNETNGLYLSVPENITDQTKDKPEPLAKIAMLFTLQNKQQYALVTRVIQYTNINDKKYIVLSHSNTIYPQNRRSSKRFDVDKKCTFSAVEISTNKDGNKVFTPKENKYEGKITNLSEGGCKLLTDMPIKQKQFIHLNFPVLNITESVYGQIVETKTNYNTNLFAVHIMFKNISAESKVNILSDLYRYE